MNFQSAPMVLRMVLLTCLFIPCFSFGMMNIDIYQGVDSSIYKDSWIGSGSGDTISNFHNNIPTSGDVLLDNRQSLMFKGGHEGGWWTSCLARSMWSAFSLNNYISNGNLNFSVYTKKGNNFLVGFSDQMKNEVSLPVNKYVTISNLLWQKVSIPVKDLIGQSPDVDPDNICYVIVRNSDDARDFDFYLNDIKIQSMEEEPPCAIIKIDGMGYRPQDSKIAKISGIRFKPDEETFNLRDEADDKIVYSGKITSVASNDPSSGDAVYNADFSGFTRNGKYLLEIFGSGKSLPVIIKDDAYNKLLFDAMRFFYYQRCGMELDPQYAGEWTHPACHLNDALLLSDEKTKLNETGGWHDAGDYGKYVPSGALSASILLMAYELMPEKFRDNQFNIPEKNNKIPDILDEVKWELDWLVKMQKPDGSVFHKIETLYNNLEPVPDKDSSVRYIIDISRRAPDASENMAGSVATSAATADFAMIMAMASRIYKKYYPSFSASCLVKAEMAWKFLESRPVEIPARAFINPFNYKLVGGTYADDPASSDKIGDKDNRLRAAAELFRTTGKKEYEKYFLEKQSRFKLDSIFSFQKTHDMAFFTYCLAENADKNEMVVTQIKDQLKTYCEALMRKGSQNPYQIVLAPDEYYWSSNEVIMNYSIMLIFASKILGNPEYEKQALDHLHYILGRNSLAHCFVSGEAVNSTKNLYHLWYNNDDRDGIPPGYLPGGSNFYEGKYSVFPAKCYHDLSKDFVTNEPAIDINAALVFVSAFFSK